MDIPPSLQTDIISLNQMGLEHYLSLFVVLLLLFCSAFISGSEVSFFSISSEKEKHLAGDKKMTSNFMLRLLLDKERLLATILIINNLVNILIILLLNQVINTIFLFNDSPIIEFIFKTVVVTLIIIFVGEILPKIIASRIPVRFSRMTAIPIFYLGKLVYPISFLLIQIGSSFKHKLHRESKEVLSLNQISEAIEITHNDNEDERKMLKGLASFSSIDVSDIQRPRVDIISIPITTSLEEVCACILKTGYSRIPVYEDTQDNIKGILHVKDLLPHFSNKEFAWQSLLREPFFVPENKKISSLLEEFKKKKVHLAIVVDEYASIVGLVTMEDILEEIVGEIEDESDVTAVLYSVIDEKTYLFEGKISITDFLKALPLKLDLTPVLGEAETLAGLILEIKGEFPEVGDVFNIAKIELIVDKIDEHRIEFVKVIIV